MLKWYQQEINMNTPKYFTIEQLLNFIEEPNRSACLNILKDNLTLFKTARGSTHNHQAWVGGFYDIGSRELCLPFI